MKRMSKKLSEEDSGFHVVDKHWVENSIRRTVQVLKTISSFLPHSKYLKGEHFVDVIRKSNRVSIGEDERLLVDNSPTDINAFNFLYN